MHLKNPQSQIETVHFRAEAKKLGFEITRLADFRKSTAKNQREKPHMLSFYAILYIAEGPGIHQVGFEEVPFSDNSLIFVNKDQAHRWVKYQGTKGFLVLFTEEFLHHNLLTFKDLNYAFPYNSSLYSPLMHLEEAADIKSFNSLFNYLHNEYCLPDIDEKHDILQCILRALLLKVQARNSKPESKAYRKHKQLFIRFQRELDERITESRNANDYCKWLGISFKQLNESCKRLTLLTPKAFIDQFLILRAKHCLLNERQNVSQIAYRIGFDEPTNFVKFFRKHVGKTPKEFREGIQSI